MNTPTTSNHNDESPIINISKSNIIVGQLRGRSVEVTELNLYDKGYFGKGTFSRSRPLQFISPAEANEEEQPREVLIITLQEAFYLVYALGCLQVYYRGKSLSIYECLQIFCEMEGVEYFLTRYATYHYCRARGWITRSGLKYGCDFMLYRLGPEHDHAKFCMRIIPIINGTSTDMSWRELQHQSRLAISVAKIFVSVLVYINTNGLSLEDYVKKTSVNDIFSRDISIEMTQVTRFMP
jgi:tRNA-intron lyase